jgi:sterol desaturase/sphingolipid hydroxylase (fatty acid hydroxylase superfamily)
MELFHGPTLASQFLPLIIQALVVEGVFYIRKNGTYPWRDSLSSLAIMAGHTLSGAISNTVITLGLAVVVWNYRLTTFDMGDGVYSASKQLNWGNILLLFVLLEFAYYWYHRSAHRIRLMWGSHSVHHSPDILTLSAAYRLSWTPLLSGSWLFFLPLVWIGFPPVWVFGMVSVSLLYQFWLHTTLIPPLGPLEWVFNTPASHRVHHASNDVYLDRNYGGVLIIFDRLFGTYTPEDPAVTIRFGLVHPVATHNPFVIVYHEFFAMLRDAWHASNWHDRLGYIFAPPGWRPSAVPANGTASTRDNQAAP